MAVKNLGKLLQVGECFKTTTRKLSKPGAGTLYQADAGNKWEVLREGDIRAFTKGKRNYICEVQGLVEMRTGVYQFTTREHNKSRRFATWYRWYMFTYWVKIIQN